MWRQLQGGGRGQVMVVEQRCGRTRAGDGCGCGAECGWKRTGDGCGVEKSG